MISSGIVIEILGKFETVFLNSLTQGCHRTLSECITIMSCNDCSQIVLQALSYILSNAADFLGKLVKPECHITSSHDWSNFEVLKKK